VVETISAFAGDVDRRVLSTALITCTFMAAVIQRVHSPDASLRSLSTCIAQIKCGLTVLWASRRQQVSGQCGKILAQPYTSVLVLGAQQQVRVHSLHVQSSFVQSQHRQPIVSQRSSPANTRSCCGLVQYWPARADHMDHLAYGMHD
jgi:hypothetical protein